MKAEIITTGTELLLGKTLNTSAFFLAGQLSGLGMEVVSQTTVGDNKERLIQAVNQALNRSEIIVLTGGLGPTADDLTKEIIAEELGLKMRFDHRSMDAINNFYQSKGIVPPGSDKQAYFPEGAAILPNDAGTAPGALIRKDGKICLILPGPPSEMSVMFERYALPELKRTMKNKIGKMFVRVLKVFGLGESELEPLLSDLMPGPRPFLTLLDMHTYMDVRITLRNGEDSDARSILDRTEEEIRRRLGDKVFGVDDETHSFVVGQLLRERKLTLATAESCSGGLLGGRITAETGSSDYYLGGVISYADSAKEKMLGVQRTSLLLEGAVSGTVAVEMAKGVCRAFGTDLGLSTTGIAGPGGSTPDKPVGLVFLGLAYPGGARAEKHLFTGNRESIRNMAVEAALNLLRIHLLQRK